MSLLEKIRARIRALAKTALSRLEGSTDQGAAPCLEAYLLPSREEMRKDFLAIMEDVDANFDAVFG